jgi:N-acetyl-anhydromuramyl-L-alanine amidase AmpD
MQNQYQKSLIVPLCLMFGIVLALGLRFFPPTLTASQPAVVTPPPGATLHQRPAIDAGLPLGVGWSENFAKFENCLPPQGTPNAGLYNSRVTDISSGFIDPTYQPVQTWARVDPTNFGKRVVKDAKGNQVRNPLLVVLHETVGDATGAVNTFQTPHKDEHKQVSYHAVITRTGKIIHLVSPRNRAYGAGNSEFVGINGPEAVQTSRRWRSSVNNFAYHISLETPKDGLLNDNNTHSGYTDDQYRALAWLIARTGVVTSRITTHEAIDRFQARQDPRSFDYAQLLQYLNTYPRPEDVTFCPGRSQG